MAKEKKEQETQVETGSVDQLLGMLESEEQKGAMQEFFTRLGKEHEVFRVTGAVIDSYIAEIDKVLSAQVDEIIHHEEFQSLESTWRGLHFLVQNTRAIAQAFGEVGHLHRRPQNKDGLIRQQSANLQQENRQVQGGRGGVQHQVTGRGLAGDDF